VPSSSWSRDRAPRRAPPGGAAHRRGRPHDPRQRYTKDITGKAFRGTTVNNIHVAKKITAKLGPVGMSWGWNVLDERIQEFGHHEDKTYKALHWVRVAMWIKGEDGKKETFENFGTTVMASYTRNGFSLDDEAPKKSMTDALSKLMVYLGGSADVWLNQFDPHNKYAGADKDRKPRRTWARRSTCSRATSASRPHGSRWRRRRRAAARAKPCSSGGPATGIRAR
jgi:hypothetical protein